MESGTIVTTGRERNEVAPIDLFADQRRRYVLQCLGDREKGMVTADLATDVTALERGENAGEVAPDAVERVYLSLYHCHVPKLADYGVVDYREGRNVVSLADGERRERNVPTVGG